MIHRTNISTTVLLKEENDPSVFTTSTPHFMFAISLNGLNMNQGLRYFDLSVATSAIIKGIKSKSNITMVPCTQEMWTALGQDF
jgi:hypothetical protein